MLANNKLTIKLLDAVKQFNAFQIYTDHLIEELAPSVAHRSINTILKNFTLKPFDNSDDVTGYIDMYPLRNIYITASGLGNFNTMSVAGDRNIVKKIPVNAAHGEVVFDQTVTGMDYLDCSRQTV